MSDLKPIRTALVSVYHKQGLDHILRLLRQHDVTLFSTGGSLDYIRQLGLEAIAVEALTGYPSILDGRVKTLHPKVFGGILARREADHLEQLNRYDIPPIDLVIVDLYPFEDTVGTTDDEATIIEKIDIGGISLIRAAAKNYQDVVIVPAQAHYAAFEHLLREKGAVTSLHDRKHFATQAFGVSAHYDAEIRRWFAGDHGDSGLHIQITASTPLRYGENPHQTGIFYGQLDANFHQLTGKALSYNNLVDVDAAIALMSEFRHDGPTFAILKHTNACGLATRDTLLEAWHAALAGDPVSAFGGVLITNREVDLATATEIDRMFYEVLIAPSFAQEATALLGSKKNRILLALHTWPSPRRMIKSILDGYLVQDIDLMTETAADLKPVTRRQPTPAETDDLLFANRIVKHLKSNGIALVKNAQLIGMGSGQTSRVDALRQAILKASVFGFDVRGAGMASEAFFPFPDCVEIGHEAGISAVIQPGGSVKDQDSIDACDRFGMAMVMTGHRHFKH